MKQTTFISIAFLAIGFLVYLNFSGNKKEGFRHTVVLTPIAPAPIGPYSQAVLTGNTLFVSGQVALDPLTGKLDTSSVENETKMALKNIAAILEASKMDLKNIVKTTVYMTNLQDFKTMNGIYERIFTPYCILKTGEKNFPARETVQVTALPKGAHIEISVIAVR